MKKFLLLFLFTIFFSYIYAQSETDIFVYDTEIHDIESNTEGYKCYTTININYRGVVMHNRDRGYLKWVRVKDKESFTFLISEIEEIEKGVRFTVFDSDNVIYEILFTNNSAFITSWNGNRQITLYNE